MLTPIVMQCAVFRGKQIPLAANITTCAKNVSMSIFGSPMKPTIQANVIGVVSKSSDLSLTGILKRGAAVAFMTCASHV